MGADAERIAAALRDRLAGARPEFDWAVEQPVGGTPVDVVGRAKSVTVLVELEWRRADPSDNAAKLFRHLATGELDGSRVVVVQLFTWYYDLVDGGVNTKRQNAEFVGRRAADAHGRFAYHPLTLDVVPPIRGDPLADGWRTALDVATEEISALL